jgi:hypothetical protein
MVVAAALTGMGHRDRLPSLSRPNIHTGNKPCGPDLVCTLASSDIERKMADPPSQTLMPSY